MENIKEAIKLLKEGYILVSYISKKKTYFVLKEKKILVKNDNTLYYLTEEDFSSLFFNQVFAIKEEENDTDIDSEKDKEYYSYSGLKH